MSSEFLMEVFYIKILVKGYIKNNTSNEKKIFEIKGIKNDNKIKYKLDDTNYIIEKLTNKIIINKDNISTCNRMMFILNKITTTEYYIKDIRSSLDINIKTTELKSNDNSILINYEVLESNEKYTFYIEMSEIK